MAPEVFEGNYSKAADIWYASIPHCYSLLCFHLKEYWRYYILYAIWISPILCGQR